MIFYYVTIVDHFGEAHENQFAQKDDLGREPLWCCELAETSHFFSLNSGRIRLRRIVPGVDPICLYWEDSGGNIYPDRVPAQLNSCPFCGELVIVEEFARYFLTFEKSTEVQRMRVWKDAGGIERHRERDWSPWTNEDERRDVGRRWKDMQGRYKMTAIRGQLSYDDWLANHPANTIPLILRSSTSSSLCGIS